MDPHAKQLSTMDPKLKEAYEKVMNGAKPVNVVHPAGEKTPPVVQPAPTHAPTATVQQPPKQEVHTVQAPTDNQSMVFTASNKTHSSPGTVHLGYATKPGQKVVLEKKKLGIHPAVYILGCIIFFIVYTLFWFKVFGLPIPFLG